MDPELLHRQLLDELFDPRASLSAREMAAVNEIRNLRRRLDDLFNSDDKSERIAMLKSPQKQQAQGVKRGGSKK